MKYLKKLGINSGKIGRKKYEEISELITKSGKIVEVLDSFIAKFPGELFQESELNDHEQILYKIFHDYKIYEIRMYSNNQTFTPSPLRDPS